MGEEQAVIVGQQVELAGRGRGARYQRQGVAHAQRGVVRRLGEHLDAGAGRSAPVAGPLQLGRGLLARVEDLAGDREQVGLEGPGRALHSHEVGVVGAAGHGFGKVRVADVGFAGAGIGVDLGVGAADTAQERPDRTVEYATEIPRGTDADVTGDVDRAPPGGGDVDRLDPVRVGDHIGTGTRHRGTNADAREALLVAVHRVLAGERRFDAGDIDLQLVTAVAHLGDRGFGQVPEHLRWPVVGEHQRQGIIVDARFGQQRTHIGRWYRYRHPRTRRS
ncbi:hypothetical protein D3C80_1239480 [compost metagenome]